MNRTRSALAAAVLSVASVGALGACHDPPPIDHCNASKPAGHTVVIARRVDAGATDWAWCESRSALVYCVWAIDYAGRHEHAVKARCSLR